MSSDGVTALPSSWNQVRLGDVAETATGGTPRRDRPSYFGGSIPWVRSGELGDGVVYETADTLTQEGLQSSNAKVFPKGTLCIALYGATVGKLGILGVDAATNQAICAVFPPDELDTRYLFRFFESRRRALIGQGKGGAQSNISQGIIRDTVVPFPPLGEQRRIVSEIDRQLTLLDAGVAALRRVQANLKRYRASILKAGCEGRLVPTEADLARRNGRPYETGEELLQRILADRRNTWTGRGSFREPPSPDAARSPRSPRSPVLPGGWAWASTAQLGEVQLGRQRSPKNVSKDHPTQYIRAANITAEGLDLSDVLEMNFSPTERERYLLNDGDIVLSEASGSVAQVGKPAIWRCGIPLCCFQNTVIRLRPRLIDPAYALLVFRHFYLNGVFAKIAGGVGINHLGAEKFSVIPFPLAPLAEQVRIVAEAQRALSVVEAIEVVVSNNLQRAIRLRQAVLQCAFYGGGDRSHA